MDYPKVLLISHSSFSQVFNNDKTYTMLFKVWPREKIAQLYFQTEIPDRTVCDNFFLVSDMDALKSIFGKRRTGMAVPKLEPGAPQPIRKNQLQILLKKYMSDTWNLMRDAVWNTERWDRRLLEQWIADFSPDVVMFVGGLYSFSLNLVRWICERFDLPVVLYYTDDYLTKPRTKSLLFQLRYREMKRAFDKIRPHVRSMLVIGDKMAAEYQANLEIRCTVVMNCVNLDYYQKPSTGAKNSVTLAYYGGLHHKRWQTLSFIGQCLKELTEETGISAELQIYSMQELSDAMNHALNMPPVMSFKGALDQKQVREKMLETDILIHVESFEELERNQTRLSISTKIPEYLASGNCILAVGPSEIASIEYLQQAHESAAVVTDLSKAIMKAALLNLITHPETRALMGESARAWAVEHHNQEIVSGRVRAVLAAAAL